MKKLALKLDELRVDSFATESKQLDLRGTVEGHNSLNGTCPFTCYTCQASCPGSCAYSCQGTCAGTCQNTCPGTCVYTCGNTCQCVYTDLC